MGSAIAAAAAVALDGACVAALAAEEHVPGHVLAPPPALRPYAGLLSRTHAIAAESLIGLGHDETDIFAMAGEQGLQDYKDGAMEKALADLHSWQEEWFCDARTLLADRTAVVTGPDHVVVAAALDGAQYRLACLKEQVDSTASRWSSKCEAVEKKLVQKQALVNAGDADVALCVDKHTDKCPWVYKMTTIYHYNQILIILLP